MAILIVGLATAIWSSTNLDLQIMRNTRQITQAKTAALSGINHFVSLDIDHQALWSQAVNGDGIIIPETQLSHKTSYRVDIEFYRDDRYFVKSTGYYKKGSRVLAVHTSTALFEARNIE